MKKLLLQTTLLLSFIFFASGLVQAQNGAPLSQISFDRDQGTGTYRKDLIRIAPTPHKPAQVRARLNAQPEFSTKVIRPSGAGPITDEESLSAVTSTASWKVGPGASCGNLDSDLQLIDKSAALEEVLQRFTGSERFFKAVCEKRTCENSFEKSVLTGLALGSTHGGNFTFVREGVSCRYSLTKKSKRSWRAIRVKRADCTCLPR